ncbi:MAG TPA: ferredoxin family protein [Polyangiaceae bacterium]
MTFVVTGSCLRCRYTDCVVVCPVDCFHGDAEMLYIDPDACIDCGACVPECPVEAIYDEGSVPAQEAHFLALNAERAPALPVVNQQQAPLATAMARALERGFKPSE